MYGPDLDGLAEAAGQAELLGYIYCCYYSYYN